jgi:hypothetical protein
VSVPGGRESRRESAFHFPADRGSRRGAHVAETALSGYVGREFPSLESYPWAELAVATHEVQRLAREHRIAVVIGSMYWPDARHKPHNSL